MTDSKPKRRSLRRSDVDTQHIVGLYVDQLLTLREIAALVGLTAAGVHKRLNAAGISTAKTFRVERSCAYCGIQVQVKRKKARRTKQSFCSAEHSHAYLENPDYLPWRHGSRLARAIVSQHFPLELDHVVHHKDGNQRNNDRANLMVFASHSDHMKHHHGRRVTPLWDGSE